jgi:APA family basic amino acid/polyamine antiporter
MLRAARTGWVCFSSRGFGKKNCKQRFIKNAKASRGKPKEAQLKAGPRKELSLFDSAALIVGIIIGIGIFQVAPDVARGVSTWHGVLLIWALGGLLSLFGALGYAELGAAYPYGGGDYVYLSRAYGRWAGFLFAWMQLSIVRPGDIAVVAFAFAAYARTLYNPFHDGSGSLSLSFYAIAAVVVLTAINVMGVRLGKWTQNLLTLAKALGLLAIVAVALFVPSGVHSATQAAPPIPASLAMIFVLFTFGGWNEIAYVAAEIKNPGRNIVRALVLGIAAVTGLYLLVNAAYLRALGHAGMTVSKAIAVDAISAAFPQTAGRLIAALVCLSALGAVNGLIFTGARISYAVGADYRIFHWLGKWNERTGTPARALLLQGAIAVALIAALGSYAETLLYTAAPVYTFQLATSLAVFVLRRKEPHVQRPYRVTGYPFTTIVFCASCAYLIYSAVKYRPLIAACAAVILLLGLPLYWLTSRQPKIDETASVADADK